MIWLHFLMGSSALAFSLLDLVDKDPDVELYSIEPRLYSEQADVRIDSRDAWRQLTQGDCKRPGTPGTIVLVELKSFCFLPSAEDLARVDTPFVLFGPFYDWHHVNFGPFSELDYPKGATIFESRLSNKLAACAKDGVDVGPADIRRLLDHQSLHWWLVQQHVRDDMHHGKIRVLPIGFGYHGQRQFETTFTNISNEWKPMVTRQLRENANRRRDILLLTSFSLHEGLYGERKGPRHDLLRNLSSIPSLVDAAEPHYFRGPQEYANAVTRSMFVLSPSGWGPDCFRTFEVIALGAIPVLLSDWATDQVVAGLPALIVKQWSDASTHASCSATIRSSN